MHFVLMVGLLAGSNGSDFILIDATERLPVDPGANTKDTLDIDFADVDGDGDLDIFVVEGSASAAPFANQLLINDGSGNFADETAARLPPGPPANSTEVDFADIDNDGDLDAVVSNLGANQLLVNNGSGVFSDGSANLPQATPPGPPGFAVPFPPFFIEVSAEAVFVDVDGDGDPDLLVSNENPFPFGPPGDVNRLLMNDGSGAFTESAGRLPFRIDQTSGYVAGDIDGDGDQDLVQINVGSNNVLINNGLGFFTDETAMRLPANDSSSRKGVLADFDSDDDLDLMVGNSRNEQNRLFLNDGDGVFTEAMDAMPARLDTTTDVDALDLDGDGDLDAYITNVGDFVGGHGFLGDRNTVLINDGDGHFSDLTFPRADERDGRSTNAEWGDVDGDGVPDLLVANSGGTDQPGLPPPDGAERLYLTRPCASHQTLCIQTMLTGLGTDVDTLDPEPFPAGDMTANSAGLNNLFKVILGFWVDTAGHALNRGRLSMLARRMRQIIRRTDGESAPPDWVAGTAAERINVQASFARDAAQ